MRSNSQADGPIRFGVFEADLAARTLRKSGARVRLQEKPFRVLAMLLARPGEVVTREELKQELWPNEEYGEFDLGLNTAVKKVRQALNDSGDSPRWIETVPKVGYKFLGPVERVQPPHVADDPAPPPEPKRKSRLMLAGVAIAVAAFAVGLPRDPELDTDRSVRRFAIPVGHPVDGLQVSPDGNHLAYITDNLVAVRSFETESTRRLAETAGASTFGLAWSPDSTSIAFGTDTELKRVSVSSGEAVAICEYPKESYRGATWSPDGGRIIFSSIHRLLEVSASGGTPTVLFDTKDPAHEGVGGMWWPHFLPDTGGPEAIVVPAGDQAGGRFWVLNLESGESHPLGEQDTANSGAVTAGRQARYSRAGYLVYQAGLHPETGIWALPFDRRTLKATGPSVRIEGTGRFASIAPDETLVFLDDSGSDRKTLAWRDRSTGRIVGTVGDPQPGMMRPDLSPDGRSVAVIAREGGPMGVWVHHAERGSRTRVAPLAFFLSSPAWSPNGKEITYWSHEGILRKSADGTGPERVLAPRGADPDWSPDGRHVIYAVERNGGIWFVELAGDGTAGEPQSFVPTGNAAAVPELSPDGRYVAYVSGESGRREVWIRRFPDGGGREQVSVNGGTQPRWRRDGRELFYVKDAKLMAVSVSDGPELQLGPPRGLFEAEELRSNARHPQYDVSPDGQRFLMPTPVEEAGAGRHIRVVENWDVALQRREHGP